MATAKAYGSITIVDISDLGTLSVTPESNQPSSIIFDPNVVSNNNSGYSPDWQAEALELTPSIYYGGSQLQPTETGITVNWQRKVGTNDATNISSVSGESVESGKLIVRGNVLTESNPLITYICTVQYVEPQSKQTLTAKGQITYSLIVQPTRIKACSISGGTIFKYNGDGQLVGDTSITLKATLSNCNIAGWQYQNGDGKFVDIKKNGSNVTSTQLVINATDSYFTNNTATIKLVTSEPGLYDLHNIVKLYDGAAGTSTISVVLSNEDIYVPCDSKGNVLDNALANVTTSVTVYDGATDVTNAATISYSCENVTGTWSKPTFTVDTITATTANVTFTVTYSGRVVRKVFNLTKLVAGADGKTPTFYSLKPSTVVTNIDKNKSFSPASVTLRARKISDTDVEYSGRFRLIGFTNVADIEDASKGTVLATSQSDATYLTYNFASSNYLCYRAELYASGGLNQLLDKQTILAVRDGADGTSAVSLVLDNDVASVARPTVGNIQGLPVEVNVAVYNGSTTTGESVTLKDYPAAFKTANAHTYENNHLKISSIPADFTTGNFVFEYSKNGITLHKSFHLSVIASEVSYTLIASSTVINPTSAGTVSFTANRTSSSGLTTINKNDTTNQVSLYINSTKVADGTAWTANYSKNQTTPITAVLKDSKGNIWDQEVIEFVQNGAGAVNLTLDNDVALITKNAAGQVFGLPVTVTADVFQGASELNASVSLTGYPDSFKSGTSLNSSYATFSNNTLTIKALPTSFDSGDAYFIFSYTSGGATFTKKFTLHVEVAEMNYSLVLSKTTVNATSAGTVTATVKKIDANGVSNLSSTDSFVNIYKDGSTTGLSNWSIAYSAGQTTPITLTLKDTNGKVWDSETIEFVKNGAQGVGGLSIMLSNNTETIPCLSSGAVAAQYVIKIPFSAYKGTSRVACTAVLPKSFPSGITGKLTNNATTTADGLIELTVAKDATLDNATNGTIEFTLTAEGSSVVKPFTWSKNLRGVDGAAGANAILLRTWAPTGNIINNGDNSVQLSYLLTEGSTNVNASSQTWAYYDYSSQGYVDITSATDGFSIQNKDLIVSPSRVDAYASFRITVKYKNKDYVDYISVQDRTDPLQIEVFSTLGDKITNGVGVGCVYARVFQNGEELDELQHLTVSETAPTTKASGDIWAQINSSTKTITLKKYSNGEWTSYTLTPECTYTWTFGDYSGNKTQLGTEYSITGKFIYVDGDLINKKMQFNLEVTKS